MHAQDMAILKGLVGVAWADGRVAAEEMEVIDALLEAYQPTPSERRELLRYAEEERTLADIPLHDLSYDDRRVLLQHAVLLTFIDGEQHEKERAIVEQLWQRLKIPQGEASEIVGAAEARAKALTELL